MEQAPVILNVIGAEHAIVLGGSVGHLLDDDRFGIAGKILEGFEISAGGQQQRDGVGAGNDDLVAGGLHLAARSDHLQSHLVLDRARIHLAVQNQFARSARCDADFADDRSLAPSAAIVPPPPLYCLP